MTATVTYTGQLHTEATHTASSASIQTDAPIDNNGKGENFSPTDLVCSALASCMMTIIGIAANTHKFNIDGSHAAVTKMMRENPRRIDEIKIDLHIKGQDSYSDKEKEIIERAALTCPVALSLHPDIYQNLEIFWP